MKFWNFENSIGTSSNFEYRCRVESSWPDKDTSSFRLRRANCQGNCFTFVQL